MELPPDTKERIYSAANKLYEEAGRQTFPTVDAVRKFARVNMNDASTGMKAWRREQSAQVAPVTVQVPDVLQQNSTTALAALWTEALSLANESLRAAQAGWNIERIEADALREQVANAYEAQATELEATQNELARSKSELELAQRAINEKQSEVDDALAALAIATAAARQAEAKAIETERRADDLHKELEHVHATLNALTRELSAQRQTLAAEINALRDELAQTRKQAELQEETTRSQLATALQEAAVLRAKLDVLGAPNADAAAKPRPRKRQDGNAEK